MTYETVQELPPVVRAALPEEAQRMYLAAYNHAWEQHIWLEGQKDAAGHSAREEAAERLAWDAVRQAYQQDGGRWVPRG